MVFFFFLAAVPPRRFNCPEEVKTVSPLLEVLPAGAVLPTPSYHTKPQIFSEPKLSWLHRHTCNSCPCE